MPTTGKSVIAAHQSSDIGLWDHIIQQFDTLGAKLVTYIYHGVSAGGVESGDPILSAVLQHLGDDGAKSCVDAVGAHAACIVPLVVLFIQVEKFS